MTSEQIKRWHKRLFLLWVMPGLPISVILRNSVLWVVVLSLYTILMEHFIAWRQEKQA